VVAHSQSNFFEAVWELVRKIPAGQVATYGSVARMLTGRTGPARSVGWALHGLPPEIVDEVPWWRVINSQGRISTSCQEHTADEQRARLVDEGVLFGPDDRVDLDRFGWWGE
jgi:methylated-DNA-protein-cysteine methyltransferase-like protein